MAQMAPAVCRAGARSPCSTAEARTVSASSAGDWSVCCRLENSEPTRVAPYEPAP